MRKQDVTERMDRLITGKRRQIADYAGDLANEMERLARAVMVNEGQTTVDSPVRHNATVINTLCGELNAMIEARRMMRAIVMDPPFEPTGDIFADVYKVMQNAEDIGGPEGMEYVNLMRRIEREAKERAETQLETLENLAHRKVTLWRMLRDYWDRDNPAVETECLRVSVRLRAKPLENWGAWVYLDEDGRLEMLPMLKDGSPDVDTESVGGVQMVCKHYLDDVNEALGTSFTVGQFEVNECEHDAWKGEEAKAP